MLSQSQQLKTPPLPFMGNKKNQLNNIKKVLENMFYNGSIIKANSPKQAQDSTIFYDIFGGSGLVAHTIKNYFPHNIVVWNDYDNYLERLEHIHETNEFIELCGEIFKNKKEKLTQEQIDFIKALTLELYEKYNYLDFITIGTFFIFSGNYTNNLKDFLKRAKYNNFAYKKREVKGYLHNVLRVREDFKALLENINTFKTLQAQEIINPLTNNTETITTKPHALKPNNKPFLILDPPYLQTQVGNYAMHFTLKNFFYLIESINGNPYMLFSSERSDILQFLEFIKKYKKDFHYSVKSASLRLSACKDYIIYSTLREGLFENIYE